MQVSEIMKIAVNFLWTYHFQLTGEKIEAVERNRRVFLFRRSVSM